MQTSVISQQSGKFLLQTGQHSQAKWLRVLLLVVLSYEGAGALLGGALLIIAPDGRLMQMPLELLHGAFPDFLIPGIILFVLGLLNTLAFFAVLRKSRFDWIWAGVAVSGLLIWFWVEIAILLQLHWLHAMWGLPVLAGAVAAWPLIPQAYRTKGLLYCGILSSILYVVINILVPFQWKGYDLYAQVVSELSAIGAPTRFLWSVLATPYTFLVLAFGWGVYTTSGQNRKLKRTGILLIAYGALGLLWPFAPMHLRETVAAGGATVSDTLHLALGAATQAVYLVALWVASGALTPRFQRYSLFTFLLLLLFGSLTFYEAPGLSKGTPTPFIGLWERVNIGLFLLWMVVLATMLLQRQAKKARMQQKEIQVSTREVVVFEELPGNGEEA